MRPVTAWARAFTGEKVVPSPRLNAVGLQVLRATAARALYQCRSSVVPTAVGDAADLLMRDGVVAWPEFLDAASFAALRDECAALTARQPISRRLAHGPNRLVLTAIASAVPPASCIHRFYRDTRLLSLLGAAERRPMAQLEQIGALEVLMHGEVTRSTEDDPQSHLHTDVFFSSHKAWLYLDDVSEADGPLAYVPGTHHLTVRRLVEEYQHSRSWQPGSEPSRRISASERARLPAERVLICAANTLVIANTCGYHRRLQGATGHVRRALQMQVRENPFRWHSAHAVLARRPRLRAVVRRLAGRPA